MADSLGKAIWSFVRRQAPQFCYACAAVAGYPVPPPQWTVTDGDVPALAGPPHGHPERLCDLPLSEPELEFWQQLRSLGPRLG